MASSVPLTWNEALSGIFGTISLASWVFLLLPQLWENYAQGHAEGISLTFLFIWALGDVANLVGAVWAGLVPTVIALAVYFTFADCVLIAQCLWYKWRKGEAGHEEEEEGRKAQGSSEQTPLLGDGNADGNGHVPGSPKQQRRRRSFMDVTDENLGLPGSRRRSSTASSHRRPSQHNRTASTTDSLTPISEQQQQQQPSKATTATRETLKNTLSILAINLAGAAAWYLAYRTGAWKPVPVGTPSSTDDSTPLGASILGYLSAIAYLGARIPQIIKNHRSRSCEGLSLLFFLLSLLGNATYGAGILFHSQEKEYVVTNLPWLIGSLGTMVEDVVIFGQFHAFGDGKEEEGRGEAVE
ncbi:hypothetical protein D0860_03578 [Hortaea werneckii]|uniref:Uncharacterized protein n=1 Tax=Hortaea werneckii TaxID=91943 RepID=A0A3M7HCR5_HORWE|nr:hypothetical protein D0860_03578 [Hortaea werneckii]